MKKTKIIKAWAIVWLEDNEILGTDGGGGSMPTSLEIYSKKHFAKYITGEDPAMGGLMPTAKVYSKIVPCEIKLLK